MSSSSILSLRSIYGRGASALRYHQLALPATPLSRCLATSGKHDAVAKEEDFFEKNKRLNRPISPHMTIYQPQITTILSITHRGTGLALTGLTSAFAIGSVISSSPFATNLASIQSAQFGSGLIYFAKYLIAFPFFFHTFNGVRHLAWDMGKGFELKQLYNSGYAVLVSSILASLAVAAM